MITSIVTALLPLVAPIGLAWINWYFKGQANLQAATDAWNAFIALHKADGQSSAVAHDNYQDQVTDLGKDQK